MEPPKEKRSQSSPAKPTIMLQGGPQKLEILNPLQLNNVRLDMHQSQISSNSAIKPYKSNVSNISNNYKSGISDTSNQKKL